MYCMVSSNRNYNKTIISLLFFFVFAWVVMTKPVMTEASPPNPEDGELWIPSDVFQEIVSSNYKPQNLTSSSNTTSSDVTNRVNVTQNVISLFDDGPKNYQSPSPQPKPTPKVYQCGLSGATVPQNWNGSIGQNVIINNNINHYYNHYNNFHVQIAPRPIHIYNPMYQPTITPSIRVTPRHVKRGGFGVVKRGGTGVFLPHVVIPNRKNGISLNQYTDQKITTHINNPGGKNVQDNKKGSVAKFSAMERQGDISTVTQNLPNNWTY